MIWQTLCSAKLLDGLYAKLELLSKGLLRNPLTHSQPTCPAWLGTVVAGDFRVDRSFAVWQFDYVCRVV